MQSDENNEFPNSDSAKLTGCRWGCLVVFLILFLPLVATFVGRSLALERNRALWENAGWDDYVMALQPGGQDGFPYLGSTITGGATLTIRDGQVTVFSNRYCDNCSPETYQSYTITSLFDYISSCVLICYTEYDTTYGYPKMLLGSGLLELGTLEVTDFRPIGSQTSTQSSEG
jgi:hypothetical protein